MVFGHTADKYQTRVGWQRHAMIFTPSDRVG